MKKAKIPRALTTEDLFQIELAACLKDGTYAGAATIAAETLGRCERSIDLIRGYALMAIKAGSFLQAQHLVVVRFPDIMTDDIRHEFRRMPKAK